MRVLILLGAFAAVALLACQPGEGSLGFGGGAGSGGAAPLCPLDACSGERCKDDSDCAMTPGTFCGTCSDDNFRHCLILRMPGDCCTHGGECINGLCGPNADADGSPVGTCSGPGPTGR